MPDTAPAGTRAKASGRAGRAGRAGGGSAERGRARRERGGAPRSEHVRVRREERALSDGYASPLLPGVHSSADAWRLAQEIAFANGRLLALAADPPGLYGELRALAARDLERATWGCFLAVYISPLEAPADPFASPLEAPAFDPFASIRVALAAEVPRELPRLDGLQLGPRSSYEPARGSETLAAYVQWAQRAGADGEAGDWLTMHQAEAFRGDSAWTPERRFQRLHERLALPGFARAGRYELLVLLGRLGLYELRADSLALAGARGYSGDDLTAQAAKRVFAIGDPLLLERRALALAQAAGLPVEALDLALANWGAAQRAHLGVPEEALDQETLERAARALGL